ncbi:hypothetical protein M9H77_33814 [Catharanthus roseus]|uniref:Uncharacterized protein n=1 Tax=Catharanthus roseus TaxID=4058 RepID=A0ACB9ZJH6_CATRO|nr:hypothetical protein M9H77_33814 [Catharanthus roseus]
MKAKTYLIVNRYQRSITTDRRPCLPSRSYAQATRLTEEQLLQTEQFRKSHVPPRNILRFFQGQDISCAVSAQKIYNVVAKIKKNRMQGRNMVEEVLCLSAQRGYMVFYRNCEGSNMSSPTNQALICYICYGKWAWLNSPESCTVSITPRRMSSDPISVGCPAVYFHSYNSTWDTAGP